MKRFIVSLFVLTTCLFGELSGKVTFLDRQGISLHGKLPVGSTEIIVRVDDIELSGNDFVDVLVTSTIDRDGEQMTFTMKRATQVNDAGREEVIQNLTNWTNIDMRPKIKSSRPLVAEDNVVIGTFQLAFTDADGNEVTWWVMERFVFNEDGELAFHADLSEELFFNQQQGYYLPNE